MKNEFKLDINDKRKKERKRSGCFILINIENIINFLKKKILLGIMLPKY
jgi:hypothetical protein